MADTKITALAAIATVDPAADVLPIVDISDTSMAASGTTKKVTTNQILGSGGTATLASATITGDLTVDTNVLKVDTTNNRVGLGTATPAVICDVTAIEADIAIFRSTGGGGNDKRLTITSGGDRIILNVSNNTNTATAQACVFQSAGTERYRIAADGVATWSVAGTTAMTLNSTGLGVGVTPAAGNFEVSEAGTGSGLGGIFASTITAGGNPGYVFRTASTNRWSINIAGSAGNETLRFYDVNNAKTRMTITATGDLLIGTTSNTSFSARIALSYDSGTTNWAVGPSVTTPTGFFISANIGAQGVYLANTTATSWTAWSDERLKDIIEPISNAVFKVGSLRAVIGKFKSDTTNTRKPFLIAQDVLAVLPEAVDVSNPKSFGVSYTEVIPLLVAAIKELTARVQTLEAR